MEKFFCPATLLEKTVKRGVIRRRKGEGGGIEDAGTRRWADTGMRSGKKIACCALDIN
jgi:hypothetical protein